MMMTPPRLDKYGATDESAGQCLRYPAAVQSRYFSSQSETLSYASLAFRFIRLQKRDIIVNGAVRGDYHATGERRTHFVGAQ